MAIRKRGKSWQVDVSMGVRHRVREDVPTYTEALKLEARLKNEYREGKRKKLSGLTFGAVVSLWLDESQRDHEPDSYRYNRERVQPATRVLGTIPISLVSTKEMGDYIATVRAATSPITARKTLSRIQTFFRWAKRNGYVEHSPVLDMPLPKVTPERRKSILTEEEMTYIIEAAAYDPGEDSDPRPKDARLLTWKQRGMLMLMCHGGLRRREVKEFAVDWLHPGERAIEIPAWAQFRPKSKRPRFVPMSEELLAWANEWPDKRVHLLDGERCIWQIRRLIRRAAKKLGKRVTPHLLRHSYASMLSRRGAPLEDIQAILGHNDIATTALYIHPLPGHVERVRALLKNVTRNVTSQRHKDRKSGTRATTPKRVKPALNQEGRHN